MNISNICLHCFSHRDGFEVCPYCGYVSGTAPEEGYLLQPGVYLWGRYVIGTVLGAGGFGITYRAWDTRLNAMVAIKEFYPQGLASRIPGETQVRMFSGEQRESYLAQLARFLDEAKNMAKFTGDAYIVSVLDYFEDNGTAYIVMEYLDGMNLKEFLAQRGGSLPKEQVTEIGTALLKALDTIHKKGIIHRDVSPDNIFVLRDGSIKLLDFGAARFAEKEHSAAVVVKKGYAPPEQYRTNMKQGVWTDIYAAGATLYKMLSGITPDESIERTEQDKLKRPSQTGQAVDEQMDKTVMKAMALRPELRFKTALDMLAALEQRVDCDFPEEELKKRKRRSRILLAVSVVLVLCMSALVAWQLGQSAQLSEDPLDVENIAADTITILVPVYPSNFYKQTAEYEQMSALAEAFEERYPQYTVLVESYSYTSNQLFGLPEDMIPRFFTEDAPALFSLNLPGIDESETPYRADLSPLFDALNEEDYLFLHEYAQAEGEEHDGAVYKAPLGMSIVVGLVDYNGAAERGIEILDYIDSFDTLTQWEYTAPGTLSINGYELEDILIRLRPDIWEEQKRDELAELVAQYADRYAQGYFQRFGELIMEQGSYEYSDFMLKFSGHHSYNFDKLSETSKTIPLVTNGEILCNLQEHYSVSSYVSENQQQLAMLFLRFALSEYGQNLLHVQVGCYIPLQKTALQQYTEIVDRMDFLTEMFDGKLRWSEREYLLTELDDMLQWEVPIEEVYAYVQEVYAFWK